MKAATTWETEDRFGDIASGFDNRRLCGFQALCIQDNESATGLMTSLTGKSAVQASVFKRGVGRTVVGELPAEHGTVEFFGFVDVGTAELDVVDAEVVTHHSCFTDCEEGPRRWIPLRYKRGTRRYNVATGLRSQFLMFPTIFTHSNPAFGIPPRF